MTVPLPGPTPHTPVPPAPPANGKLDREGFDWSPVALVLFLMFGFWPFSSFHMHSISSSAGFGNSFKTGDASLYMVIVIILAVGANVLNFGYRGEATSGEF